MSCEGRRKKALIEAATALGMDSAQLERAYQAALSEAKLNGADAYPPSSRKQYAARADAVLKRLFDDQQQPRPVHGEGNLPRFSGQYAWAKIADALDAARPATGSAAGSLDSVVGPAVASILRPAGKDAKLGEDERRLKLRQAADRLSRLAQATSDPAERAALQAAADALAIQPGETAETAALRAETVAQAQTRRLRDAAATAKYEQARAGIQQDQRAKALPDDGQATLVIAADEAAARAMADEMLAKGLAVGPVKTVGGPARFWIAPAAETLPQDAAQLPSDDLRAKLKELRPEELEYEAGNDGGSFTISISPDRNSFQELREAVRKAGWHITDSEVGLMSDEEHDPTYRYCRIRPTPAIGQRTLRGMTNLPYTDYGGNGVCQPLTDGGEVVAEPITVAGETRIVMYYKGGSFINMQRRPLDFVPGKWDGSRPPHRVLRADETLTDEQIRDFMAEIPGQPQRKANEYAVPDARLADRLVRVAGGPTKAVALVVDDARHLLGEALGAIPAEKARAWYHPEHREHFVSVAVPRAFIATLQARKKELRDLVGSDEREWGERVTPEQRPVADAVNRAHITETYRNTMPGSIIVRDTGGDTVTCDFLENDWLALQAAASAAPAQKGK